MLATLVRETVTQTWRRATSPLTGARQADIDRRLVAIESERDALNPDTAFTTVSTNVLRWRSLSPAVLLPPVQLPLSSFSCSKQQWRLGHCSSSRGSNAVRKLALALTLD